MRPGPLAVGVRVLDAHGHGVCHLSHPRRPAVVAHVADDDRAVAEAELRAVTLADLQALDEPERSLEPGDGFSHIRVDQHRDHGGRGRERLGFTRPILPDRDAANLLGLLHAA